MPFGGRNSIFRKPLGTGRRSAGRALSNVGRAATKAVSDIKKASDKTIANLKRETSKAAGDLGRSATRLASDLDREANWLKEDIDREATGAKSQLDAAASRIKSDLDREAARAIRDIEKRARRVPEIRVGPVRVPGPRIDIRRLKKDIDRELTKAKKDVDRELTRAKENIDREATKLKEDFEREIDQAKRDIDEAVDAASQFVEKQISSMSETLSEAEKMALEGKLFDALWHLSTEPINDSSDNLAEAVTSSSLLSQAASIAASTYGGPSGAAAYSAWLAYETTGDLETSLKVAVAAGIAVHGGSAVSSMSNVTVTDAMKRSLAKAAVNAASVAASGGDEGDIEDAFMGGVSSELSGAGKKALQNWIRTEIEARIPEPGEIDFDEPEGSPLIAKAKALGADIAEFQEEWEDVLADANKALEVNVQAATS